MSGEADGRCDRHASELVIVSVCDEVNQSLTGHEGCRYESPPQPREQALTLARVLLGYTSEELDGGDAGAARSRAGGARSRSSRPPDRCKREDYDACSAHSRIGAGLRGPAARLNGEPAGGGPLERRDRK